MDLQVAQRDRERGIARYLQSLVVALVRDRPDVRVSCLIDPRLAPPMMLDAVAQHARIIEDLSTVTADGDVTHFLQGGLFDSLRPVQSLFPIELRESRPRLGGIVYDMIPWLFPAQYLSNDVLARAYLRVVPALSRLDRIFALSDSVRRDVLAIAGAEPSRVVSIYGGFDEDRWRVANRRPSVSGSARDRLEIRNDNGIAFSLPIPFWLYVGGDDARKNLRGLIAALALVIERGGPLKAPLVIACSMESHRRMELLRHAANVGVRPDVDVYLTDYVSDETLGHLLTNCMASVFPSLYEGLGLPVIESYAFGKPVLASDTSSLKELVPERCRFDPESPGSIADAMLRFHSDPQVAEDSLAFAPRVLALSRWSTAAGKVGEWLDGPTTEPAIWTNDPALWVASSVPPEQSGVAFYTQRSLGAPAKPVALFVPSDGAAWIESARYELAKARHATQREVAPVEILGLSTLADARVRKPDHPVLFVLGNSHHHLGTLDYLMTYGARTGDAVHLHDVFLDGLIGPYSETGSEWPRHGADVRSTSDALPGPVLLVRHAGVRHFIVNSEAAARRLRQDLGNDGVGVRLDVLFLPVLPVTAPARPRETTVMRIGHFGILGPNKQPELLVAACDLLAEERPIELVFAGYGVSTYLRRTSLSRRYMRLTESPPDTALVEVMASVDCAVQLRFPDYGESSGVVNQLLALRRPVVCTGAGSFAELQGAVHLVRPDASPADLATAIEQSARTGWPAQAEAFVEAHSPWAFESRLRELLRL